MSGTESGFAPVAVSTGEPIRLAMQRLWLSGQVMPPGGRLVLHHVFRSDEDRPLEVIYSFPLPRDAALREFRITGDGFEVRSELKPREEAARAYEQGIAEGSLAALVSQYGDGLINLTIGNIRPQETVTVYLELLAGVELRDGGFRFRFPFTLAPSYHPRARAAVTEGEGEIELPAEEFGDLILPRFRKDASSLHEIGFELSLLHQLPIDEIASPSHGIRVRHDGAGPARVALAPAKDVPNRDLVLDVHFKEPAVQVLAGPDRAGKRSFAAVIPSTRFGARTAVPRRIAILLDRSGSMHGEPIAQARKAIEACLAALTETDSFVVMAFDDSVEAMHSSLVPATREQRERARAFLDSVDARGGTELAAGVEKASRALGGRGGDILILTDGQVFGTEEILRRARAAGTRLFTLGIGSASQDRFLALLARETGGISRFVNARERVDLAAVDLFASMGQAIASGLKASGVQPEPPRAVFAGTPVLLFGELEPDSDRRIEITWDSGRFHLDVPPGDGETGCAVRLLRGSRLITDLESRYAGEEATAPLEKRRHNRIAARLAELSMAYGLASREMSLVAVVKRQGDRAGELPETRVVPVGMPQDTDFSAYFGLSASMAGMMPSVQLDTAEISGTVHFAKQIVKESGFGRRSHRGISAMQSLIRRSLTPDAPADLIDLAAMLEPDGGMPGINPSVRLARTIAAVFAFVAEGHTSTAGAFRSHVSRLVKFLESFTATSDSEKQVIQRAIEAASAGTFPPGPWLALACASDTSQKQIEEALQ